MQYLLTRSKHIMLFDFAHSTIHVFIYGSILSLEGTNKLMRYIWLNKKTINCCTNFSLIWSTSKIVNGIVVPEHGQMVCVCRWQGPPENRIQGVTRTDVDMDQGSPYCFIEWTHCLDHLPTRQSWDHQWGHTNNKKHQEGHTNNI